MGTFTHQSFSLELNLHFDVSITTQLCVTANKLCCLSPKMIFGVVRAHLPRDDYVSQSYQQTKGVQMIPLNPPKRRRPYQVAHPTPMLTLAAQNQIHF